MAGVGSNAAGNEKNDERKKEKGYTVTKKTSLKKRNSINSMLQHIQSLYNQV